MRQSTKTTFIATRGSHAVLPCRAAVVVPDPDLHSRPHPPPPRRDRLTLAQAQPRPAGPARARLPAQRRHIRRARGRVRSRHGHGLAARAPKLRTAIRDAVKAGYAYVIVDGTLIPVDRVAADRPFYSGKHKRHGMNPQPGRRDPVGLGRAARRCPWPDRGAGEPVRTPYRERDKPASQKEANRAHARLRAPGERANAQLKCWQILRK